MQVYNTYELSLIRSENDNPIVICKSNIENFITKFKYGREGRGVKHKTQTVVQGGQPSFREFW